MQKPRMDANFINPFVQGTLEALRIQCSFSARYNRAFVKGKGPDITTDIASVIALSGPIFQGSVAVCFPKKVFLGIMGKMFHENYAEITPVLEDGAAELLNIIFGHAKRLLNEKGFGIEQAIPSIVRGQNITVNHVGQSTVVILPFETELGTFHIELGTRLEEAL